MGGLFAVVNAGAGTVGHDGSVPKARRADEMTGWSTFGM